jgi:hypothetical protein
MKAIVYAVMAIASLFAWLGGVSPLLTQNYDRLSFIGMVCAILIVVCLLVFRTHKFNSLIDEPEIGQSIAKIHAVVLRVLIVGTLAVFLAISWRISQGSAHHWQNIFLQPFALFFIYSAGWLLKKPRFVSKHRKIT